MIEKPSQINSKILNLYMKHSENGSFPISHTDLKEKFELLYNHRFESNFSQMKNFGTKNHAKVFSESEDGMVSLWEQISIFVKTEYNKFNL